MAEKKDKPLPDNEGDLLTVKLLMPDLVEKTETLIELISSQDPYFVGYGIERISKEDEKNCIVDGVNRLEVKEFTQWTERHTVLNTWKDFYAPLTGSTMFVYRLPGFVVVKEDQDRVLALVNEINALKDKIAETVRCNRDKHQRHDFIHSAFPGVMTEQLYRKIQVNKNNVKSCWFNWASRPVPITMSIKEAVEYVENKKGTPPIDFGREDWVAILDKTIVDIKSGRYKTIQKLKQFRLLPTIEFNMTIDGKLKRRRQNATTPFILLGQENKTNPTYTPLEDYKGGNNKNNAPAVDRGKEIINAYLRLAGVL